MQEAMKENKLQQPKELKTLPIPLEIRDHDPHHYLGLHSYAGKKVIRLFRPDAHSVHIELFGKITEARKIDSRGHFEVIVPDETGPLDYRIYHNNGALEHDPYVFQPTFGEMDGHLFANGVHYELYNVMGGRLCEHGGCQGVKFALWAPSAKTVSLVGDFNHWDGRVNPMRSMGGSGVWELFVPGLKENEKYKFEIKTQNGDLKVKSDPYAYFSELRPNTASEVFDVDRYEWKDSSWREKQRTRQGYSFPLNIYEVHLGSWKKHDGWRFMNYKEIAHELADYCKKMGFSHVELMPVAEHPLDESWGYQVTGFYAVTSRYGTPEDFQYFVDYLHQNEIGVIMDWVGAHFPMDDFSLSRFDGTCLYEHEDPRKGFHPHWNTHIFNYGRKEVANFLLANALFWFDKMHIDGLRADAVASMLYLDYGREPGEWIPNIYGGNENLEAVEFLKHLNSIVHERAKGALMFAEESTAFTGITHSLQGGGMGFDMKWNMGWMNDTLRYFQTDPLFRNYHQNELTFGLIYAFSERFVLVLSHDEVVHGKANLISKMPGDIWQKFANVRLLYTYMLCQPGKKLLFMGGELGQWDEWNCKVELQWHLLQYPIHSALQRCIADANHLYHNQSPLWENDVDFRGFEWIDFSDSKNSVISYLRKSGDKCLFCVHNFTPAYFQEYYIGLKNVKEAKELFNSDRAEYGGSGKINGQVQICQDGDRRHGVMVHLAPLATMIFEVKFV